MIIERTERERERDRIERKDREKRERERIEKKERIERERDHLALAKQRASPFHIPIPK